MKKSILNKVFLVLISFAIMLSSYGCGASQNDHPHEFTSLSSNSVYQKEYYDLDLFNDSGLKVYGKCSKCGKVEITDYTVEYETGADRIKYNDTKVFIKYGDLSLELPVTVASDSFQLQIDAEFTDSLIVDYLKASTDFEQAKYLMKGYPNTMCDRQTVKLSWFRDLRASKYSVKISESEDLSNAIEFTTENCEFTPGILMPNKRYYAKVYALDGDNNEVEHSPVKSFSTKTDVSVRLVNIDGLFNVRDLGGWTANGNSKVKYGMLYRGATTAYISEDGVNTFANILGIKNEVDVRTTGTHDAEISGVAYKKCGMWQYGMVIPELYMEATKDSPARGFDSGSPSGIKAVFELLADESNYPMYLHCAWGADRTGTICYLINGLLGVSYDDLVRDFELTSFSKSGQRYRSKMSLGMFDTTGIMQNNSGNFIAFGQLNSLMVEHYGKQGKPLSYAIENYLLNVCEVSQTTIDSVRRIMLETPTTFERVG